MRPKIKHTQFFLNPLWHAGKSKAAQLSESDRYEEPLTRAAAAEGGVVPPSVFAAEGERRCVAAEAAEKTKSMPTSRNHGFLIFKTRGPK